MTSECLPRRQRAGPEHLESLGAACGSVSHPSAIDVRSHVKIKGQPGWMADRVGHECAPYDSHYSHDSLQGEANSSAVQVKVSGIPSLLLVEAIGAPRCKRPRPRVNILAHPADREEMDRWDCLNPMRPTEASWTWTSGDEREIESISGFLLRLT